MMRLVKFVGAGILVLVLGQSSVHSGPLAEVTHLRFLTINVWSGLDYEGFFKYGEYESKLRRGQRFDLLLTQIRELDPDVIFLQEANPVGRYANRLADALDYDQIHKVVNGGIKLGPLGLPVNLKEGLAILARKTLGLRRYTAWKLSGPFGFYGDVLTIHFSESIWALAGSIRIGAARLFLVDVHLIAAPPDDEKFLRGFRAWPDARNITDEEFRAAAATVKEKNARRTADARKLADRLRGLPQGVPVLVAGDFNAEENDPAVRAFIAETGAFDTLGAAEARAGQTTDRVTWDSERNENVAYSSRPVNASGKIRDANGLLDAYDSSVRRRLDYIFLPRDFRPEDVLSSRIAIRAQVNGVHASDHFGVFADVDISGLFKK
jgi:endonuclease/exonuclease/phosphatase family metal-dependent hydrolase